MNVEKKLFRMDQIKPKNVPMYDELSVKNLWPHMQSIADFMVHFPDKLPKNRLPDRKYFFTVMNTINDDYVA